MEKLSLKKAILTQAIRELAVYAPEPVLEMAYDAGAPKGAGIAHSSIVQETYPRHSLSETSAVDVLKMELLSLNDSNLHKSVEQGSIVFTNKGNFLAGIETGPLEVNNIPLKGIARQNPIFTAMLGKKRGDQFQIQREVFRIWDVF